MALVTRVGLELTLVHTWVAEGAVRVRVVFRLCTRGVTTKAWLLLMSSDQLKPRHAVVKARLVPPSRTVTLTTGRVPKGVAMWVLFAVACHAGRLDRLIMATRVAFGAVHPLVATFQLESTHLVMVEAEMPPREPCLTVTGAARLATKLVSMIVLMTIAALRTLRRPLLPFMAIRALVLAVLSSQRPTC